MMKKILMQLKRTLPEWDAKDEDSDFRGFVGNISNSSKFITDGHSLWLRSAIDPTVEDLIKDALQLVDVAQYDLSADPIGIQKI